MKILLPLLILSISYGLSAQDTIAVKRPYGPEYVDESTPMRKSLGKSCGKFRRSKLCLGRNMSQATCKDTKPVRLCADLRYFDRVNRKNRKRENQYGTWYYGIQSQDEDQVVIFGSQTINTIRTETYIYLRVKKKTKSRK